MSGWRRSSSSAGDSSVRRETGEVEEEWNEKTEKDQEELPFHR